MARSRTGNSSASVHAQPAAVAEAGAGYNSRPTRVTRSQSREPVSTSAGVAPRQKGIHGMYRVFFSHHIWACQPIERNGDTDSLNDLNLIQSILLRCGFLSTQVQNNLSRRRQVSVMRVLNSASEQK